MWLKETATFVPEVNPMKTAILGGTFDPIHQGHLALARAANKQFSLDRVIFVPAFIPPHKAGRRDMTPAPYRYRMTELALQGEAGFEISDIEFSRPEISYTVDTLQAFKEKFPEDRFFLILGEDSLAEMSQWKEPGKIREMTELLAAKRPGASAVLPAGARWIEMPECPISSSSIRQQIRNGESPGPEILPAPVEKYIRTMNLYRSKTV